MSAAKQKSPPAPTTDLAAAMAASAASLTRQGSGIGTLRERTLHSTLKFLLEPDERRHEVPLGGCVADIFDGECVTEVQTGSLYPLQKKLATLLADVPVTVVMPLAREKWVGWIDPATGERGDLRRSPKRGTFADALAELWWVREFWQPGAWAHPFTVRVLLIDLVETRLQDGWGRDGKRGAHRADRVPLAVADEYRVECDADVAALLPPLPDPFTRGDLSRALGRRGRAFSQALRLLEQCGAIVRCGKRGNAFLYTRAGENRPLVYNKEYSARLYKMKRR